MISEHSQSVAKRAKSIYTEKLQSQLELEHPNQFVAIEPESEEYFLAESPISRGLPKWQRIGHLMASVDEPRSSSK